MKFKPVPRKTNPSKMDFEGLIAKGVIDTECGMRAQTVNGEARCFGEVENTGGGGRRPAIAGAGPLKVGARVNRTGE